MNTLIGRLGNKVYTEIKDRADLTKEDFSTLVAEYENDSDDRTFVLENGSSEVYIKNANGLTDQMVELCKDRLEQAQVDFANNVEVSAEDGLQFQIDTLNDVDGSHLTQITDGWAAFNGLISKDSEEWGEGTELGEFIVLPGLIGEPGDIK